MADDSVLVLRHPPIVEAVLDIDCDLPPALELASLEGPGGDAFRDRYPNVRRRLLREQRVETAGDRMEVNVRRRIQAFQFASTDEKQLVQVRSHGFSFNRLAPYSSLDDYLPEIERTWGLYVGLASPVLIRLIRLRYINRILLPLDAGGVKFNDYFRAGQWFPEEDKLAFLGFLNQHTLQETATGNLVRVVLTSQANVEGKKPIVLDNCVEAPGQGEPEDWPWILAQIRGLRDLKNRVFRSMLTEKCLNLFQ